MIPLKLTLEGLYSYQSKQVIDFTRLTEAELFGIFGATGSGKSSILEAISFALYGQTERLSSREAGGTAYHMMNLKSNRIYLDFEFAAGVGEEEYYRFTVANKRKRTDFSQTQTWQRRAFQWVDNDWYPLEDNDASRVIGLSYDHFKRTIIIPQGKFEEFIQLKSTERSKMLQDIFALDKFELSGQIKRLQNRNRSEIDTTEGRLGQYTAVTQEAIDQNQREQQELEAQRKQVQTELKLKNQQREQQEQLRERFEKIQQKEKELTRLEEQQPQFQDRQRRLDRYIRAKDEFGVDLSEKDRQAKALKDLDQRLQEKRKTQQQVQGELDKKQKLFVDIEQNYLQRDQLLRQAEELEQVLKLQSLRSNIQALEDRAAKGQAKQKAAEKKIADYEKEVAEREQQVEQLEKQRPNLDQLVELEKWYAERRRLRENLARETKERKKIEERIDKGKTDKQRLAREVGFDLNEYDLNTAKLVERLQEQQGEFQGQRQQLEKQQQQLQLRQRLHQMAGELQPGDPCPLCGSTEHPAVSHQSEEDEALRRVQRDLDRLDQNLDQIRNALPRLQSLLEQARELQPERKAAVEAEQAARQALDLHQSAFVWPDYQEEDEESVKKRLAAGREIEQQLQQQQQKLKDLRGSIRDEQQQLSEWRPALEDINRRWNQQQGEFDSGRKALQRIAWADYAERPSEQIRSEIHQAQQDYQGRADIYQRIQREIEERKGRIASLGGEIGSLDRQHEDLASSLAQLNQKLDQRVQASEFEDLDEVRLTLEMALGIDAEKEALREFDRELTEARTTLRDLREQVGEAQFDAQAFDQLKAMIQQLESQQAELTQQIGGKEEFGKRLAQDLADKQRLEKKLEQLRYREENLKTLEGLFRGNGFVNYISTAYLENLCAAANERFLKLNQNSLSLEVDEDNNFHVRDLLNGGKRRSIKTLSGGQTFQAALCLALALSDQVQQQVQTRQNFFFLDEGFGSQDKNSLQVIFRTLKSLRQENRIVGVISHVEELQQEIETYLHIRNDAETGSRVKGSWE